MIIAITGGTGFVGKRLVRRSLEMGHQVRILSRKPRMEAKSLQGGVVCFGDLNDPSTPLNQLLDGVDVFYHCAGEIRDPKKMFEVNVNGTRRLLDAAKGKIGRWVQLSSVGVYGPKSKGLVTEDSPFKPLGMYEETKTQADLLVLEASQRGYIELSILRPSNIFAPDMNNLSLFQLIEMVNRGFFFYIGKSRSIANYIHVENVIEALIKCGTHPKAVGKEYILSDHLPMHEFIGIIYDSLGKPRTKLWLPEKPLRFLIKILERFPNFPLKESRIDALTSKAVYSSDQIKKTLGYKSSISLEDGIKELVKAWDAIP